MPYQSNFKRIAKQLNENERRALEAIGLFVRGEAQVRCPVDTGNLRDSIDYQVNEGRKSVMVGTNVEYGIYVEKGTGIYAAEGNGRKDPWVYQDEKGDWHWTRGQRPQPYLTPAFEDNKKRIQRLAAEQLGRGLR
jgi:HK97 gp10 family phage protein